jgi:hypothetical protein
LRSLATVSRTPSRRGPAPRPPRRIAVRRSIGNGGPNDIGHPPCRIVPPTNPRGDPFHGAEKTTEIQPATDENNEFAI